MVGTKHGEADVATGNGVHGVPDLDRALGPSLGDAVESAQRGVAPRQQQVPGALTPGSDHLVATEVLRAKIDHLRSCVGKREPDALVGLTCFLDHADRLLRLSGVEHEAADVRLHSLQAAQQLFAQAHRDYHTYVRGKNCAFYLAGLHASAAILALVPFAVYALARYLATSTHIDPLAQFTFRSVDLPSLLILFGFASLGSMVSVVMRIDRLDLPRSLNRSVLAFAGAGRPLVAVSFAAVVYALLHGRIVNLGSVGATIPGSGAAHWWCVVVAFMCGYSERFAKDLLGQSPFGGSGVRASPREPGEALSKS